MEGVRTAVKAVSTEMSGGKKKTFRLTRKLTPRKRNMTVYQDQG